MKRGGHGSCALEFVTLLGGCGVPFLTTRVWFWLQIVP